MGSAATEKLIEIERELERTIADAHKHRNGLITMTSFQNVDQLARISEIDIIGPLSRFTKCTDRARELLADKRRITAATA